MRSSCLFKYYLRIISETCYPDINKNPFFDFFILLPCVSLAWCLHKGCINHFSFIGLYSCVSKCFAEFLKQFFNHFVFRGRTPALSAESPAGACRRGRTPAGRRW